MRETYVGIADLHSKRRDVGTARIIPHGTPPVRFRSRRRIHPPASRASIARNGATLPYAPAGVSSIGLTFATSCLRARITTGRVAAPEGLRREATRQPELSASRTRYLP